MKKKTVNFSEETHKYLKVYAAQQGSNIERCVERIVQEFLIRSGTLPSKEITND